MKPSKKSTIPAPKDPHESAGHYWRADGDGNIVCGIRHSNIFEPQFTIPGIILKQAVTTLFAAEATKVPADDLPLHGGTILDWFSVEKQKPPFNAVVLVSWANFPSSIRTAFLSKPTSKYRGHWVSPASDMTVNSEDEPTHWAYFNLPNGGFPKV